MDALMSLTARLTEKFPSSRLFSSAALVDWAPLVPTTQVKAMAPTSNRVRIFTRFSLSTSGESPPNRAETRNHLRTKMPENPRSRLPNLANAPKSRECSYRGLRRARQPRDRPRRKQSRSSVEFGGGVSGGRLLPVSLSPRLQGLPRRDAEPVREAAAARAGAVLDVPRTSAVANRRGLGLRLFLLL